MIYHENGPMGVWLILSHLRTAFSRTVHTTAWQRRTQVYDAMFEAAAAASTIEEQQRLVKDLDMYAIERHWAVWGGMSPVFEATQPWLTGFSGEVAGLAVVFPRLWIDSELKEAMGR